MKRKHMAGGGWLVVFILLTTYYLLHTTFSYAAVDPLARQNNFVGIHILFPHEVTGAADLINSSGGDWGYATIPIQYGDRDLGKWQEFMNEAKKLHVIPLIRLATESNPHNTAVWRKPNPSDILDFANFLSSLDWPTKNKYVILFNEVNRFDEWGGEYPNPLEYSDLVSYAFEVFKKQDPNFYLILAGMDASAPNDYKKYINGFTYLEDLVSGSDITSKIDAFSSHAYPNPGFSAPPIETSKIGVASYRYEYALLNQNATKKLPVFITETGWSSKSLSEAVISNYYKLAFTNIWGKDKDKIIAITPFLLNSTGGSFDVFSFMYAGQTKTYYKTLAEVPKTKGDPELDNAEKNYIASTTKQVLASETFRERSKPKKNTWSPYVIMYFKTIFGLN